MPQIASATLLGIPLECRQQILEYLFEGLVKQDVAFSIYNGMVTSMSCAFDGRKRLPKILQRLVGSRWEHTVRAPHIGKIADTLASVHPQIANDVAFVVNKCLEELEKDYNLITKSSTSAFKWWESNGLSTTVWLWWSCRGLFGLDEAQRDIDRARRNIPIYGVIRPGYVYVNPSGGRIKWQDPNVLRAIEFAFRPET
jgi:hypothetical protein